MADLRTIDTLARLRLAARRAGTGFRADVTPELRDLIGFCGLDELLDPLAPKGWPPPWWTRAEAAPPWPRRR